MKKGPLSAGEIAEIDRLALSMKEPTPGKIARRLERQPSTIQWQMMRRGLWERKPLYPGNGSSYIRNGRPVFRFDAAEDAQLLALREQGITFPKIASMLTFQFQRRRTAHSVQVRAIMLAATAEVA